MMEKTSTSLRMVYLIDIISFQYATNQNFVVVLILSQHTFVLTGESILN